MTDPPRKDKPHETPRKQAEKGARQQRLAEEMRKNLLKRKAQWRKGREEPEPPGEK